MQFDIPKEKKSIIKVIGVGGGGSNAVNHMYRQGIKGVEFVVCNTDSQTLELSPVPVKIQLGATLTEGRGAGSIPEMGRNAALEASEELKKVLENNTKMLFITAGMGGGTGTGAAPVVASLAKELGILTVGIVTIPFLFEGNKRKNQAFTGLEELKKNVDTLLVISNDKLREIYGNLTLTSAFAQADNILTTAAKGIAEIITVPGYVNVDFEDVKTVMTNSGVAIMGSAVAEGDDRAALAVQTALESPLLNDNHISGARYILLNIASGTREVTMDEISEITDYIQEEAGQTAEIIWGNCFDESLEDRLGITIIATGFKTREELGDDFQQSMKKVHRLEHTEPQPEPEVINLNEPQLVSDIRQEIERQENFEEPYIIEQNEDQLSFELEVNPQSSSNEPFLKKPDFQKKDEGKTVQGKISSTVYPDEGSDEEQKKRSRERSMKLKELSFKIKSPGGISDLEKEPAYKRREVKLDNTPHSSESDVSRYSLSEDEDKNVELRSNNSFLHDNVD